MSLFLPAPAAPGSVSPAHLDKVRELHLVVRDWIEASAVAQRNEHIRANLPYVDLMFAFGFATLGDHATANKLVEGARLVLEVPMPTGGTPQADQAVTAAHVSNFLFLTSRYRIERALAGEQHAGPLGEDVRRRLDEIRAASQVGSINNPYKMAVYAIDRFLGLFTTVEPDEQPDPYSVWTKDGDALRRQLRELQACFDAERFRDRVSTTAHG